MGALDPLLEGVLRGSGVRSIGGGLAKFGKEVLVILLFGSCGAVRLGVIFGAADPDLSGTGLMIGF